MSVSRSDTTSSSMISAQDHAPVGPTRHGAGHNHRALLVERNGCARLAGDEGPASGTRLRSFTALEHRCVTVQSLPLEPASERRIFELGRPKHRRTWRRDRDQQEHELAGDATWLGTSASARSRLTASGSCEAVSREVSPRSTARAAGVVTSPLVP